MNAGDRGNKGFCGSGGGYYKEMFRTEERLSEAAKMRRRLFSAHYIKTTNATSSADFAGFKSPAQIGYRLLREPYVQQLIQSMLEELDLDAIMTKREVLFRFKEEANNMQAENQGARISALAHIAKIHGMMVDKSEVSTTGNGGVMLVPVMGDATEWGALAEQAQAELKEKARE